MDWRSSRHHDHPPIVFAGRHADRMCLTALDAAAERLNLKLGQGVSEARAIFPELDVMDEDDDADAALLMALSDWCDRYTPLVTLEGRNGLSLDITGCADYGGESRACSAMPPADSVRWVSTSKGHSHLFRACGAILLLPRTEPVAARCFDRVTSEPFQRYRSDTAAG
jgi:hypothetical protein